MRGKSAGLSVKTIKGEKTMEKIGFIGCGNMGSALAKAACKSAGADHVMLANRTKAKAEALASELGCTACGNEQIASECQWIFLAVKPQMMADMLAGIAPVLRGRSDGFVLVTMAAGLSCEGIAQMAGGDYPVIRIMPNTPVAIGQGVVQVCANAKVSRAQLEACKALLAPAGLVDEIEEKLIDAASSVSGCGPAFAYLFIEALADGGVACGLPRAKALQYAAQMLAGSAELVLQSGQHPGQLKDAVCSPGGTTIQGVRALEANGFRSAAMEAVLAAYEKTLKIGK